MKAAINDAAELEQVGPEDIVAYLRAHGWQEDLPPRDRFSTWTLPLEGLERPEVLIPRKRTRDYVLRVSEALRTLASVESRSQIDILRAVSATNADVIRLRRPSSPEAPGAVPLSEGVKLVEEAQIMMTAAACSAVTPRRVVPTRRPAQAVDYLRTVKLGQTEQSSFILTIVSPMAPSHVTPSLPGLEDYVLEEPFPRKVTRTLSRALTVTKDATVAAAKSGNFAAFDAAVEDGVSADLCEALAGLLVATGGQGSLAVELSWAATVAKPGDVLSTHEFVHAHASVLEDAARHLRETSTQEALVITGVVTKLQRDQQSEVGTVTVACVIEGAVRRLLVPLGPDDYRLAVDAHRDRRGVFFKADVIRLGKQYHAETVEGFRVLD